MPSQETASPRDQKAAQDLREQATRRHPSIVRNFMLESDFKKKQGRFTDTFAEPEESGEKMQASNKEKFIRNLCNTEYTPLYESNVYGIKDCNGKVKLYAVYDENGVAVEDPLSKSKEESHGFKDTRIFTGDGDREELLEFLNTSEDLKWFGASEKIYLALKSV